MFVLLQDKYANKGVQVRVCNTSSIYMNDYEGFFFAPFKFLRMSMNGAADGM